MLICFFPIFTLIICTASSSDEATEASDPTLLPPTVFTVPESVPPGHIIGYVEGKPIVSTDVRYFVVFTENEGEGVSR